MGREREIIGYISTVYGNVAEDKYCIVSVWKISPSGTGAVVHRVLSAFFVVKSRTEPPREDTVLRRRYIHRLYWSRCDEEIFYNSVWSQAMMLLSSCRGQRHSPQEYPTVRQLFATRCRDVRRGCQRGAQDEGRSGYHPRDSQGNQPSATYVVS